MGVVLIGGLAVRWSRRRDAREQDAAPAATGRQDLQNRLDDELRDLD
jgi:hypothetical protein